MWFPRGQKEGIVNKSENRNSKEGISRKRNQAFLLWMREKKRRFQHEKRLPYADSRECMGQSLSSGFDFVCQFIDSLLQGSIICHIGLDFVDVGQDGRMILAKLSSDFLIGCIQDLS